MKILGADLWPVSGADQTFGDASQIERARGQMRLRQLIENILLYDQVVLPTDNFLSLDVLARTFGAETVAILIDEGLLKFRRYTGMLAYAGAGHGLTTIRLGVDQARREHRPIAPAWLPTGVAATAILSGVPNVTPLRAKQISAKIVHATKEIELETLRVELRDRVSSSIVSGNLDAQLIPANKNLNDLEIRPDQLRLVGSLEDYAPTDDIDRLMAVARTQLELLAKEQCGCDDLSTLSPVGKVLVTSNSSSTALGKLYEITDVPDLGSAAMQGAISINEIVKLRQSKHWIEFVRWFHESCASEPDRVAKEYVKLLRTESKLDSGFFKIVRLFVTTVIGAINPVAGIIAGAADTFALPRLKEPAAKYFIENLEQLTHQQRENK